jgi:hypothetical protein
MGVPADEIHAPRTSREARPRPAYPRFGAPLACGVEMPALAIRQVRLDPAAVTALLLPRAEAGASVPASAERDD